ncbi:MAG: hypothetical protein HY286_06405 [Planctomycetes bacterium]|nr:hypothetical protein [Planctomycetota bacterium]
MRTIRLPSTIAQCASFEFGEWTLDPTISSLRRTAILDPGSGGATDETSHVK